LIKRSRMRPKTRSLSNALRMRLEGSSPPEVAGFGWRPYHVFSGHCPLE
jgi:hypothetical protein